MPAISERTARCQKGPVVVETSPCQSSMEALPGLPGSMGVQPWI